MDAAKAAAVASSERDAALEAARQAEAQLAIQAARAAEAEAAAHRAREAEEAAKAAAAAARLAQQEYLVKEQRLQAEHTLREKDLRSEIDSLKGELQAALAKVMTSE